ncbi:MAG: response regulator transcription factor [gamma proteobacterium symbiont of Bathyaustriella thionipta]|nr:response regulator transcription factor [gamma proteobacterium symbiont of Bathyaustriella thionipta]MCU7954055.1 response regulator transcription factor [gamma proteobacterium symbiont of Bathyaustriella thionipta]
MYILLIEDDQEAAQCLMNGLIESGHQVDHAADGKTGLDKAMTYVHDILIVDRMLPGYDGLSIIQILRNKECSTPALILSALGEVDDRIEGLRAGGDDYLAKPYAFDELLIRLEVLLRRRQNKVYEDILKVGDLTLNLRTHDVNRAGQRIRLQPKELRLLEYLMRHADQLVSRSLLLEKVWGFQFDPVTSIVDTQISRLRKKIDKGFETTLLHTIRGKGFMISES